MVKGFVVVDGFEYCWKVILFVFFDGFVNIGCLLWCIVLYDIN